MQNWLATWGYLIVCAITAVALGWIIVRHYSAYLRTSLPDEARDEMTDRFLGYLRTYSSGPNEAITLEPGFWPSSGWSHTEALRLLQHMNEHGLLLLPGFSIIRDGIVWWRLPDRVALTTSSYDLYSPQRHSVVINGNVNGPTHLGSGDIVNNGSISYQWTTLDQQLNELALNLYQESRRQSGELSVILKERADILAEAADTGDSRSPIVKATLKWVVDLANSTTAGLLSAGLIAAANAILAKM